MPESLGKKRMHISTSQLGNKGSRSQHATDTYHHRWLEIDIGVVKSRGTWKPPFKAAYHTLGIRLTLCSYGTHSFCPIHLLGVYTSLPEESKPIYRNAPVKGQSATQAHHLRSKWPSTTPLYSTQHVCHNHRPEDIFK
jgi:hypothetical protein